MPTANKIPSSKKTTQQPNNKKNHSVRNQKVFADILLWIRSNRFVTSSKTKARNYLARRPHRSFQHTYRRDYTRSLNLPGYWSFTNYVKKTLWDNRKVFFYVLTIYVILTVALISFASEDTYMQLRETLDNTGEGAFDGFWGEISKASLILAAGATGALNSAQIASQAQNQIYAVIIGLLTWLTTVWLLRAILAGHKPRMRDGLYNSGAPIVPTFLVATVVIVQLLPFALAIFAYNSAVVSGLLDGGVEAMAFWAVAGLLVILSLYWLTSTLFALVVVTLPGMYPMQALRTAGDLVIGRRLRILLRLLWMAFIVIVHWVVIVIPIILLDGWLKSVWEGVWWLPLVPVTLLMMGSLTVIWTASYIYLLYRRIVDDDALPA